MTARATATPEASEAATATGWPDVQPATHRVMAANRSRDTQPELAIRRMLHARGYRFRLCRRDLPGRPDIAVPGRRAVIEVRGCFWHAHGCAGATIPKTRPQYWVAKMADNRRRDARNAEALAALGWRLHDVWECELRRDPQGTADRAAAFLDACARQ